MIGHLLLLNIFRQFTTGGWWAGSTSRQDRQRRDVLHLPQLLKEERHAASSTRGSQVPAQGQQRPFKVRFLKYLPHTRVPWTASSALNLNL